MQDELQTDWQSVQNDPLVVDSVLPGIAHRMYPALFKSPAAFSTETGDYVRFENERVGEMIDIVSRASGRQYVIFVVDEVGQYVGSRDNLILNLDGLAKNLKGIGDGKVWIIGTAQQTLTEDDPRAALNSPLLYKLKDRFPIQIDLESSDIREICYRRLLGKSSDGERVLGERFDRQGQALRQATKLHDAKYYDADFDRTAFVNLYPFLPAHFDILLHLLGALAKSTVGIGLRSAIKVVQDILIEGADGRTPAADRNVGWLATTVTLYDALEKDIRRAFPSVHAAVEKSLIRFPDSPLHQEVAKTVAVLQVLGNLPVTVQNVAGLMHPAVDAPSRREQVDAAAQELVRDKHVPLGEENGALRFYSEKLNDIDQERAQVPLRSVETRRIQSEALRDAFTPLPSVRLHGTLAVTSGLKAVAGLLASTLAGERETVQTVVEFVDPKDYETSRTRLVEESRQRSSANTVYLVGRRAPDVEDKVAEIYRCREIAQRYRSDPDVEVREYCTAQSDRGAKLTGELQHLLKRSLAQGSFVFRGRTIAVESLDADVVEASKKHLAQAAEQVFERYGEAAHRAETNLAEKFLLTGNLRAVTSAIDPLGLVQITGGSPRINIEHKALVSIRDYLDRNGTVEGKRLTDHFTDAPFGWSQDTLRYLVAALLWAGKVTLKVGGREVKVVGQQALDALKNNTAFKQVGVSLRDAPVPMEMLARAAQRLTDLAGENVIPLEDEISKSAAKHLPRCQHRVGPLPEKLSALGLPGAERARSLGQEIADLMLADASDAPQRLGSEESPLYEGLKWTAEVEVALRQGLESTIRDLQQHRQEIETLPDSGVPGTLRNDLAEELALLKQRLAQPDFYRHTADLATSLTTIKASTRDAVIAMANGQRAAIKYAEQDLQRLAEWAELTREEQSQVLAQLDCLVTDAPPDLRGLRQLLRQEFVIASRVAEQKAGVIRRAQERQRQRLEEEIAKVGGARKKLTRSLTLPASVSSPAQLDDLIRQLQVLRQELSLHADIEVTIRVEDKPPSDSV